LPQPIEAQAVGGLSENAQRCHYHAVTESRENFIVGPHKSESYHESLSLIMSLIMHLFRTNIHDLQINKCLQSLYVTTFEKL
jgi:hypothetical protein